MSRPTQLPLWATDVGAPIATPGGTIVGRGYHPGDTPAAEHLNFLFNRTGQWHQYLSGSELAISGALGNHTQDGLLASGSQVRRVLTDRLADVHYASDFTSLGPAITAANASGKTLVISTSHTIASPLGTISAPVRWEGAGRLVFNTGGSIALTGPQEGGLGQRFQLGTATSFAGLTSVGVVPKVYPQWWGAVGNGVANDTAAFHAAMAAHHHVRVPHTASPYLVNLDLATVTNVAGLILEGDGYGNAANGTTLKAFDDTQPIISGIFTVGTAIQNLTLRDITLSQSGGSNSAGNHGIDLAYVYDISMDNVIVINPGGWGMRFTHCFIANIYYCQVFKGSATRGLGGVNIVEQGNAFNFIGGTYNGSGDTEPKPGFQTDGQVGGLKFYGVDIERWDKAVVLDNTSGKITDVYIDIWAERNATADVQIGSKLSDPLNIISGVTIRGNLPGPVAATGHSVELWGTKLYGITIEPGYVTNRVAVVDIYGNVQPTGIKIDTAYHRATTDFDYVPAYAGTLIPGIELQDYGQKSDAPATLTANSATPSVRFGGMFITANTSPTTYTDFLNGLDGQTITILVNDANSTFAFTGSTNLKGNGGVNFAAPQYSKLICTRSATLNRWLCTVESTGAISSLTVSGSVSATLQTINPTNGGTSTPNASLADAFLFNAGAGVAAFTIGTPGGNPSGTPTTGMKRTFIIKNASGGALTTTWPANFKMAAWVDPGNGFKASLTAIYDGTNWNETTRSLTTIPN